MCIKKLLLWTIYNNLVFVYSYTHSGWLSSENETQCMYVSFKDLIADENSNIKENPEKYFDSYNSGYDTVENLLEGRYGDNYNLTKIQ